MPRFVRRILIRNITSFADGSDSEPDFEEAVSDNEEQPIELFKDAAFPPSRALGHNNSDSIIWKRPHEICDNPKMYVDGGSQFDVCQGELGDCWFLAAIANLSMYKSLLQNIAPDQTFKMDEGYTGKFNFNFYQYGKWVQVEIDDRLPTKFGQLVYVHSASNNEFWSALLEKAYAKLNGSYENLIGGNAAEAMVDITGGMVENFDLSTNDPKISHKEYFKIIMDALHDKALVSCGIQAKSQTEANNLRASGLLASHAYSITGCGIYQFQNDPNKYKLIRLRNPWGKDEWKGAFSDTDPIWGAQGSDGNSCRSDDEDGEFWMPFSEWIKTFTKFEFCRLNVDDFESEGQWIEKTLDSSWKAGTTAGGCGNFDTFTTNPFLRFSVEGGKESDQCIISLQQKFRRKQKSQGAKSLSIGFCVFESKSDSNDLIECIDRYCRPVLSTVYCNRRDMTQSITLPKAGHYIIVPTTFSPGQEGKFFMRIYIEKPCYIRRQMSKLGEDED